MTNKEILQANLLDIVFEHRNKNYGAYALRKTYPQRLQWALGICLGFSLLLLMINFMGKKTDGTEGPIDKGVIQFIDYVENPKQQETQKPKEKTPAALVKDVTIKIVPDDKANSPVPADSDLDSAAISNRTQAGTTPTLDTTTTATNTGNGNQTTQPPEPDFHPTHKEAEFPGGKEAFARFLQSRLNTPDDLEAGQKQAVVVRFMVDTDGNISKIEIVQSGGEKFDKEVIRVLKKMPKWKPAEQNEVKVPVYFTQVVTFVGIEQ